MNESRITKIALFGFLSLAILTILLYLLNSTRPFGEKYRPIEELGGPFTLRNMDGDFSLSDIEGKVGVLYFGFLSCTEACPASIAVMQSAYSMLTDEERDNLQFVFISVDPERDTPEDLSNFSAYYGDMLTAVSGTEEEIDELTRQYGAFFEFKDLEGSAMQYTVDHASRFYLVDKQGKLFTTMSHSTTPTELAARMQQLLHDEVQLTDSSK